jgi:glutathione S-transferase
MLTLYQAEWCPYSPAVRQRLTELGIDFVANQVEPRQQDREGEHEIPLLVTEDGERFEGTDEVFMYLAALARGSRSGRTARSTAPIAPTVPVRRRRRCSRSMRR